MYSSHDAAEVILRSCFMSHKWRVLRATILWQQI